MGKEWHTALQHLADRHDDLVRINSILNEQLRDLRALVYPVLEYHRGDHTSDRTRTQQYEAMDQAISNYCLKHYGKADWKPPHAHRFVGVPIAKPDDPNAPFPSGNPNAELRAISTANPADE